MYFSGHLLDGYGKHIAASGALPLSELCGEDAALSERMHVRVAGVVTSVTKKMTKKDEQMAFFTVEDRYNEIECLAFPRQYGQIASLIGIDAAVLIDGNVSLKDEEAPKIIVSAILPLVEDGRFTEDTAETEQGARSTSHAGSQPPRQRAETRNETKAEAVRSRESGAPERPRASEPQRPNKLYLRVASKDSEAYRKVANLLEIFDDGSFPVIVYDRSTNAYTPYPHGVYMSDYVRREIETILGAENVVFR